MWGYLIAAGFVGACWLGYKVVNVCVKKGGIMRPLGIITLVVIGSICIGFGYYFAYIGYLEWKDTTPYQVTWPVAGWLGIVAGTLLIISGIWRSLRMTKEQVELEEKNEKLSRFKRPGGYVACPKCGLENWEGYDKCQKCGVGLIK